MPYAGTAGPEPKRRTGLMIGLVGGGVTLVLALMAGLVVVFT